MSDNYRWAEAHTGRGIIAWCNDNLSGPGNSLLHGMLALSITIRLARLSVSDGPTPEDWGFIDEYSQKLAIPTNADALVHKSEREGLSAEMFNGLARVAATMAFVRGGITLFGDKWEAGTTRG